MLSLLRAFGWYRYVGNDLMLLQSMSRALILRSKSRSIWRLKSMARSMQDSQASMLKVKEMYGEDGSGSGSGSMSMNVDVVRWSIEHIDGGVEDGRLN